MSGRGEQGCSIVRSSLALAVAVLLLTCSHPGPGVASGEGDPGSEPNDGVFGGPTRGRAPWTGRTSSVGPTVLRRDLEAVDDPDHPAHGNYSWGRESWIYNIWFANNTSTEWTVSICYNASNRDPSNQSIRFRPFAIGWMDKELKYKKLEEIRNVTPTVDGSSIRYNGAFEGVDIEYVCEEAEVKEYIYLSNTTRAFLEDNDYKDKGLKKDDTYLVVSHVIDWGKLDKYDGDKKADGEVNFTFSELSFKDLANKTKCTLTRNVAYTNGSSDIVNMSLRVHKSDKLWHVVQGLSASDLEGISWPVVVDPSVIIASESGVFTDARVLAYSSNGTLYAAYSDGDNIHVVESSDDGLTWGGDQVIYTQASALMRQCSLCVDVNDNIHVAWKIQTSATAGHKVFWAGNSTWSGLTYIRDDIGNYQALVPDNNGSVYAFFAEHPPGGYDAMKVRRWNGTGWEAEVVIREAVGTSSEQKPDAVVHDNGTVRVVWQGWTGSRWAIYYSYSLDEGATWSTPAAIDTDSTFSTNPSICLDESDNVHVTWQGKNSSHVQTQAVYIRYDGSSWSTPHYLTDVSDTPHQDVTVTHDYDTLYATWTDGGSGGSSNHQLVMRMSTDWGDTWTSKAVLIDRTNQTRYPRTLYYEYPEGCGNVPMTGFALAFVDNQAVDPHFAFYYSNDFQQGALVIFDEHPQHLGTWGLQPWCHVAVEHEDGLPFNVAFLENSTGAWVQRQVNATATNGTFWWQYSLAAANNTTYYWKVVASNATYSTSKVFRFTTGLGANSTGSPIVTGQLFRWVDGHVVETHDLVNDTYSVLFRPYRESSGWIANGAPSITYLSGVWYVSHRMRTGDTYRGRYLLLNSSVDLLTWPSVFNVSVDDVSPLSPVSWEKSTIRWWNGSFYLYFCYDAGAQWNVMCIKSATVEGLATAIVDSDSWIEVLAGSKDPTAMLYRDGWYYWVVREGLYRADNPEGDGIAFVQDLVQLYEDRWGGPDRENSGPVMYDEVSGQFIYFQGFREAIDDDSVQDDLVFFFARSRDLGTWYYADRHVKIKNWSTENNNLRYGDYYVGEDNTFLVMEWDDDLGTGNKATVLWVYENVDGDGSGPDTPDTTPGGEGGGGGVDGRLAVDFDMYESFWGLHFVPRVNWIYEPVSYRWFFGDGHTSRSKTPTHYYRSPGNYTVTLSVEFDRGGTRQVSRFIMVGESSLLSQVAHSVELREEGLFLWLGNEDMIVWPEMGLFLGGIALVANAWLQGVEARRYRRRGVPDRFRGWRRVQYVAGGAMIAAVLWIELAIKAGMVV